MTTDYHGKIVEETSTYYVALEQIPYMRAFRRVKYSKDVPGSHVPETAPPTTIAVSVTQSYDLPTFRSSEVPAVPYFTVTGGGGEFSGGGASSSYESSSSDSSSDSSSSSSD